MVFTLGVSIFINPPYSTTMKDSEFEILDYSESKSSFSFNFGTITALSLPGFLTQFEAIAVDLTRPDDGVIVYDIQMFGRRK